jgi:hypothetical protein
MNSIAAFETGTYKVTSAGISYLNREEKFRNIWNDYESETLKHHRQLLQFRNPRISECGNYFIEDVASAMNPEKTRGIAKRSLTSLQKANFKPEELVGELWNKSTPETLEFF